MSSGMPKVTKVLRSAVMSPAAPSMDFSTMGQPEYRSTITIYVCPLWWKKSAHRLWKGLVGRIGGVGGSDAWEGDITLHVVHDDRWFDMSAAMPGQKMDASAFACIIVVPWWAEWRNWRQSSRNAGGMTTLSLKMTTPSTV